MYLDRLPSFKSIEAFVVAARTLSFTAASAELHVTVPAVSRRIQALEAELGAALFDRQHRGLELTAAGRAYAERLAPALESIRHAGQEMRARSPRNCIKVNVRPCFATSWLFGRIQRFTERHHGVHVELETASHELETDSFDVGIRLCDHELPGLDATALFDVRCFAVCSPGFARQHPEVLNPAELAGQCLLGTRHLRNLWADWLAAVGVPRVVAASCGVVQCDNLALAYEAAAAGLGVALGFDVLVDPYFDDARLVRCGDAAVSSVYRMCALVRPQDRDRLPVRNFLHWLNDETKLPRPARSLARPAIEMPPNSMAALALRG